MTVFDKKDTVPFAEFTECVQKMTAVALRQAELLGVKPEPNAKAYISATPQERFIAYLRSSIRQRTSFEHWLQAESEYLKQYHVSQWIARTVETRLYSQEYLEYDTVPVVDPQADTDQTEPDAAT